MQNPYCYTAPRSQPPGYITKESYDVPTHLTRSEHGFCFLSRSLQPYQTPPQQRSAMRVQERSVRWYWLGTCDMNCSLLSTFPDLGAIPADSVIFHEQTWGRKEGQMDREREGSVHPVIVDGRLLLRSRDDAGMEGANELPKEKEVRFLGSHLCMWQLLTSRMIYIERRLSIFQHDRLHQGKQEWVEGGCLPSHCSQPSKVWCSPLPGSFINGVLFFPSPALYEYDGTELRSAGSTGKGRKERV